MAPPQNRVKFSHHSAVPVLILAGGLGTRLSEETQAKPKPMVEIGDLPILVHIMRRYYAYGFNDFVICAGYRSWEIKQFFLNYQFRSNHLDVDHRTSIEVAPRAFGDDGGQERWRVRIIDTGQDSMTGARVARAFDEIGKDQAFEDFAVTYGDGVGDIDLATEFEFHRKHGKLGTVLGVAPMARFGELDVDSSGRVKNFSEKPQASQGLINGGFFFFKRQFREYLSDDASCVLEKKPMTSLSSSGQLMVFKHPGFWQPMDTLRDRNQLQALWESGQAPWVKF